mmetsp:Transcript_90955/g.220748  ORF Transcript_90955/g.220748 Transcript_90955/m.220748 type:complete len:204 (+) Transcript_90955:67-678(+)
MQSVGIIFELRRAETLPGETVRISGSSAELGAWATKEGPDDSLRMRTGALRYPCWSMSEPVWINFEHAEEEDDDEELPALKSKAVDKVWPNPVVDGLPAPFKDFQNPFAGPSPPRSQPLWDPVSQPLWDPARSASMPLPMLPERQYSNWLDRQRNSMTPFEQVGDFVSHEIAKVAAKKTNRTISRFRFRMPRWCVWPFTLQCK